jgi:hypothetical protein
MASSTAKGGFVLTLKTDNIVGQVTVDNEVLEKIVEALGIPKRAPNLGINKAIDGIRSIYVFRGE